MNHTVWVEKYESYGMSPTDMATDTDADTKKFWTADTDADTDIEKLLSADTDADTDMKKLTYRGHVRGRGQVADTRVRRTLTLIMSDDESLVGKITRSKIMCIRIFGISN